MKIDQFAGIRSFHDGMSVSDYINMIPLENSCIDRLGESTLIGSTNDLRVIQTFVDSKRNVYIATDKNVKCYRYNPVTKTWGRVNGFTAAWGSDPNRGFEYIDNNSRQITSVSFCESTTKPSQVFMCDGEYVYYWNTEQLVSDSQLADIQAKWPNFDYYKRVEAFTVNILPVGDFTDFNDEAPTRQLTTDSDTGYRGGWWPTIYDGTWAPKAANYTGRLWCISSITWYENRLVLTDKSANTVRLSVIRPDRWIIPTFNEQYQEWLPYQIWWYNTYQDAQNHKKSYCFIPHAYISTASSALLQDTVAFAGQLYFLNDTSIEVWTNTYNEDAPIQQNTMSTIHFGGRSPCIVADTMFLIAKDTYHNDFIAAIKQGGQIQRISNDEIERRLMGKASIIRPLSVRDNSFVVIYNSDPYDQVDLRQGLSVTKENKWWTYDNRYLKDHTFGAWAIMTIDGKQLDVGNHGELIEQVPESRLHCDGSAIYRAVRGCFTQLPGRVIVREVEVVCDTGVYYNVERRGNMYLRLSFDRGLSFGKYMYRTLGEPGRNDRRIVWRNCGSGNSFLMEFGTSDNVRFQLYEIDFELQ